MVATRAITLARGLLGWVPSFAAPPWSLNAPYAKLRRFHGEAISCKMVHHTTYKTLAFLPLVVVHCLSHLDP